MHGAHPLLRQTATWYTPPRFAVGLTGQIAPGRRSRRIANICLRFDVRAQGQQLDAYRRRHASAPRRHSSVGQTVPVGGGLTVRRYSATASLMQVEWFIAVWPMPVRVKRTPLSSCLASTCAPLYGVDGSAVVPITTIGGEPAACRHLSVVALAVHYPQARYSRENASPIRGASFGSLIATWSNITSGAGQVWSMQLMATPTASVLPCRPPSISA